MKPDPRALRSLSCALAAGGALALSAVGPVACGENVPAPFPAGHRTSPRRGGVLRLASFQDVRLLDPAVASDGLAAQIDRLIFAGLVDFDARGHVVADLAERWDVEDDGRAYRFFLRPGVRMHDGAELTADDVKRSAERALHPSTPDPNASYFDNLLGYDDYAAGRADHLAGVEVAGRYVVVFHVREPDATFLPVLALNVLRPTCASGGERYSDGWRPCGAGPFELEAGGWQRGTSLRLVRHGDYFRAGLPYLDAVEWTFNMQLPSQRFRFEDGTLDILRDITQADQARFAADPRWRGLGAPEPDRTVLGESMNTRMPPFDNVEVRRAVAAAIDRRHYQLLKPAFATVLTGPLPPDTPGYDPDGPSQRYDYAAALEHMRNAGYPYDPSTGQGGWPAPIVYPLYDQGLLVYTAQLLQQDLRKIGLRLELRLLSWTSFLALQERPGGAALSQANWQMDYPDPSAVFDPLFTTAAIGSESSFNTAFYSNPRFDRLVARARRQTDPGERGALYREASAILCDEAPWAFTLAYHFYDLRQPYVRDFDPRALPTDVSRVWIDRAAGALLAALGPRGTLEGSRPPPLERRDTGRGSGER